MSIYFYGEEVDLPNLSYNTVVRCMKAELRRQKNKLGTINVIFCNDEYLLSVNKEFLKHDYYTDVITFDYTFNEVVSGDLFVSVDRVKSNAISYGQTYMEEMTRVVLHGFLHLLKFSDKKPDEIILMRFKEEQLLGTIRKYNALLED